MLDRIRNTGYCCEMIYHISALADLLHFISMSNVFFMECRCRGECSASEGRVTVDNVYIESLFYELRRKITPNEPSTSGYYNLFSISHIPIESASERRCWVNPAPPVTTIFFVILASYHLRPSCSEHNQQCLKQNGKIQKK